VLSAGSWSDFATVNGLKGFCRGTLIPAGGEAGANRVVELIGRNGVRRFLTYYCYLRGTVGILVHYLLDFKVCVVPSIFGRPGSWRLLRLRPIPSTTRFAGSSPRPVSVCPCKIRLSVHGSEMQPYRPTARPLGTPGFTGVRYRGLEVGKRFRRRP